jgi:hypothetical protein
VRPVLLGVLSACQETASDGRPDPGFPTVTEGPTSPLPTDPVSSETEDLVPTYPASDIDAAMIEAVELALELHIRPVVTAFDAVMAYGDAYCPTLVTQDGYYGSWYANCATTYTDTTFGGSVYWYRAETPTAKYDSFVLYASVQTPLGLFASTGSAEGLISDYGSYLYEYHYFDAALFYDGPEVAGTWFGEGKQPNLTVVRTQTDLGGRTIDIDGAVSGLAGAIDTVDYVALYWGSDCAEPVGGISVRTTDAVWFDAVFGDDCDGCGPVTWRGVEVGEVCVDFSPWQLLEVTP